MSQEQKAEQASEESLPNDTPKPRKHANHTSWKKGQSGNPRGRPKKGDALRDWLKNLGDELEVVDPATGKVISFKEALARAAYKNAIAGDVAFFREIVNRLDGPPTQPVARSKRDTDDQIMRAQMEAILDAVADDPVRRQQVLDLMEEYFEVEAKLAALSTHKEISNGSDTKE